MSTSKTIARFDDVASDSLPGGPSGAPLQSQILPTLHTSIDTYPKALSRIAKYIVTNPHKVIHQSVVDLAAFSGSGSSSVMRLSRSLGFDGFRDLKIALAAELARRAAPAPGELGAEEAMINELHGGLIASAREIVERLDRDVVRAVVAQLVGSDRIDIYGAGGSGPIADYLAFLFLESGLNAHAFRDANSAHAASAGLSSTATAIGISQTGATPDTVNFLHHAQTIGATTIAITDRSTSRITRYADQVLLTATMGRVPSDDRLLGAPRVFLVEILAALAAQARIVGKA